MSVRAIKNHGTKEIAVFYHLPYTSLTTLLGSSW
jgi:hypothetical protein